MAAKQRIGFLLLIVSLLVLFAGCYRMNFDTLWRTGVTADGDSADPGAESALPVNFHPVGSTDDGEDQLEVIPADEPDRGEGDLETAPGTGPPEDEETPDQTDPGEPDGPDGPETVPETEKENPPDTDPEDDPPKNNREGDAGAEPGSPDQEPGTKPEDPAENREAVKRVALTFDDGPDQLYTPKVLDILHEYGVPGTFFLVGTQVEKFQDTAKRIVDEGHSIGNHTWNHTDLSKLSAAAIREQIRKGDEALKKATGTVPSLVRAPYGAVSKTLKTELSKLGRELIGWTVDPRDWAGTSVEAMRKNVNDTVRPGGIILLHSFGGKNGDLNNTLELLPLIIDDLHQEGYEFVTIEELLEAESTQK